VEALFLPTILAASVIMVTFWVGYRCGKRSAQQISTPSEITWRGEALRHLERLRARNQQLIKHDYSSQEIYKADNQRIDDEIRYLRDLQGLPTAETKR
jgi:hypothetical protein